MQRAQRGLDVLALERGEGDWENIQDVLRMAFRTLQLESDRQNDRLAACEHRAMDLGENCASKVDQSVYLRHHQQLETTVQRMNALSDELKQSAAREEQTRRAQDAWMRSTEERMTQWIAQIEARMTEHVQSAVATTSAAVVTCEKRLELMEEELHHVIQELESKANVGYVDAALATQKKTMEAALKLRCRKVAFDREVLRVHHMLRGEHDRLTERCESVRADVMEKLKAHLSISREDVEESRTALWNRVQSELDRVQKAIGTERDEVMKKLRHDCDTKLAVRISSLHDEVHAQIRNLQNETTQSCKNVAQTSTSAMSSALSAKVDGLVLDMQKTQAMWLKQCESRSESRENSLGARIDAIQQQLTEFGEERDRARAELRQSKCTTTQSLSDEVVSHAEGLQRELKQQLEATIKLWTSSKEKKMRQQMHAIADKLADFDQIVKLMGSQLVQNTSRLQLLWSDNQDLDGGVCNNYALESIDEHPQLLDDPNYTPRGDIEGDDTRKTKNNHDHQDNDNNDNNDAVVILTKALQLKHKQAINPSLSAETNQEDDVATHQQHSRECNHHHLQQAIQNKLNDYHQLLHPA